MYIDALTLAAIRAELTERVVGSRVQRVHLPEPLGLAFQLYGPGGAQWLLCSAHPQYARIHLVSDRPDRLSDAVTPLLLLLRKHVRGSRLVAVEQPPLERVLRLRFERGYPNEPVQTTVLVVEVMDRLSNLILLDADEVVLDSAKRVGPQINRYRTVLPRHDYRPPPPQDKLDPTSLTDDAVRASCRAGNATGPLWRALVGSLRACSPLLAQEVAYRATGSAETTVAQTHDWSAVSAALGALFASAAAGSFEPQLAYDGPTAMAFAPYRLTQHPGAGPVEGMSRAIELFHASMATPAPTPRPGQPSVEPQRRPLQKALTAAAARLRSQQQSLQQADMPLEELERLRLSGEWLLALAHEIQPGQTALRVEEAASDGGEFTVSLDPELTPQAMARRYFHQHQRQKRGAAVVAARLAQTRLRQHATAEALALLAAARTVADVRRIEREAQEEGLIPLVDRPPRRRPTVHSRGFDRHVIGGTVVLVGRSSRGNDQVTFREAQPNDLWLHARGVPGAHVVIRTTGPSVPEHVVQAAAALAAEASAARNAGSVAVDYTRRRYVRRIKGAPPGLVTYRQERTVHVVPNTVGARG
ncbi:MAG: hypothetical protein CL878_05210 [Dehalococcoidia bacterium]|nr:hypothetical protein [Dehalococcoidia bacterium]